MNVYMDKNGFTHFRKSKNRVYIGQLVSVISEVKEAGEVEVLLGPKLSKQACKALTNAKVESIEII